MPSSACTMERVQGALLGFVSMKSPTSLSGLDSAFLWLETPSTPMHMLGTFVLDAASATGGYSFERVVRLMEERAPGLAPFRRKLAATPFGVDQPVWIDDSDFSVRSHLYRVAAPAPGSDSVLARLTAQIASQRLDRTRPLWELWVVEGLTEGRVALVFKVHHALVDGVSAIQLLLQMLDPSPEGRRASRPQDSEERCVVPTRRALLAHAVSRLPERGARFTRLVRDSTRSVAGAIRSMISATADTARMPMPFTAPTTPWNDGASPERVVAYGKAPLADVKLVSTVFGTTVNHVILAACTQTLRQYLEAHGGVPAVPLVAAVPISLRRPEELGIYGNRVSALLVHLPVHLTDPVDQLLALKGAAASSKQAHDSLGVSALGGWAEFVPARLLGRAAHLYSDWNLAARHRPLHNLVISNVRGPGTPLYAAGARLTAAYPLGPLMDGAGLNITVVSYVESVDFGVIACERSVPQLIDIALGFGSAVADLHKLALKQARKAAPRGRGRSKNGEQTSP